MSLITLGMGGSSIGNDMDVSMDVHIVEVDAETIDVMLVEIEDTDMSVDIVGKVVEIDTATKNIEIKDKCEV